MAMIYTRDEFIARMNKTLRSEQVGVDCRDPEHPLWIAETQMSDFFAGRKCQWFVCVKPIKSNSSGDYWSWITSTLEGTTTCFASDTFEGEEWWGFTEKNDITVWMLKWAT